MSTTFHLSNKAWFKTYVLIRQVILCFIFLQLLLLLFNISNNLTYYIFTPVILFLFIGLLAFDHFQRPALFELITRDKQVIFNLFIPDTRYFLLFKESYMQALVMDAGDRVNIQEAPLVINWDSFRKLGFFIQDTKGDTLQLRPFHFGWATREEIVILEEIITKHNAR